MLSLVTATTGRTNAALGYHKATGRTNAALGYHKATSRTNAALGYHKATGRTAPSLINALGYGSVVGKVEI